MSQNTETLDISKGELKDLSNAIQEVTNHRLWPQVSRIEKELHWGVDRGHREMDRSAALAWLLNPREAHGLGDRILKRLIKKAATSKKSELDYFYHYELESLGFLSAVVQTEFVIDECGRIDIYVLDPVNEVALIIERKDGAQESFSSEGTSQLKNYEDFSDENLVKYEYEVFHIISGHSNWIDSGGSDSSKNWIKLDDQWLFEELDRILDENLLKPSIRHELSTLRHFVFSFDEWEKLEFYKDCHDSAIQLFHHTEDALDTIFGCTYFKEKPNIICKALPKLELSSMHLALFYVQNQKTLRWIEGTTNFEYLEKLLIERFPGQLEFGYATRESKPVLDITLSKIDEMTHEHDLSHWPIYLRLSKETPDNEGAFLSLICQHHKLSADSNYTKRANAFEAAFAALTNASDSKFMLLNGSRSKASYQGEKIYLPISKSQEEKFFTSVEHFIKTAQKHFSTA